MRARDSNGWSVERSANQDNHGFTLTRRQRRMLSPTGELSPLQGFDLGRCEESTPGCTSRHRVDSGVGERGAKPTTTPLRVVYNLAGRWSQLSHSEKVLRERRPVLVRLPMPRDAKKPPRAAHRCTGWFRGKGEGRTALRRAAACLCSVSHLRYGQDCK